MTVMELIERLECCDTEAKVYFVEPNKVFGESLIDVTFVREVSEDHENQVILS